jgi:hypothetical protein
MEVAELAKPARVDFCDANRNSMLCSPPATDRRVRYFHGLSDVRAISIGGAYLRPLPQICRTELTGYGQDNIDAAGESVDLETAPTKL